MRELVKLAEKRESKAKCDMAQLLESRSEMFEITATPNEIACDYDDHGIRIEDAQRRMNLMKQKFHKLSTLCISAEQGLASLNTKLMVALEQAPPSSLKAAHAGMNTSSQDAATAKMQTKPGRRGVGAKDIQRTEFSQASAGETSFLTSSNFSFHMCERWRSIAVQVQTRISKKQWLIPILQQIWRLISSPTLTHYWSMLQLELLPCLN